MDEGTTRDDARRHDEAAAIAGSTQRVLDEEGIASAEPASGVAEALPFA